MPYIKHVHFSLNVLIQYMFKWKTLITRSNVGVTNICFVTDWQNHVLCDNYFRLIFVYFLSMFYGLVLGPRANILMLFNIQKPSLDRLKKNLKNDMFYIPTFYILTHINVNEFSFIWKWGVSWCLPLLFMVMV